MGPADRPRRLRVVGNSGAGKTTYARALAARLGLAHAELDEIFWDANWTWRDEAEARARLAEFLAGPGAAGWVIDGNWNTKVQGLLDEVDTIVWLDYSRWVIMPRVIGRTLSHGITRRELWHGNRETLTNLLRRNPEENIVLWAWTQQAAYRAQYGAIAQQDGRVLRLTSPRAARRWLASLAA